MANLLDLLWDLVERPEVRTEYLGDPVTYLRNSGHSDLTGEDVTAALEIVRDLVPVDHAVAITERLDPPPSLAPVDDEQPIGVAIRLLSQMIASVEGLPDAPPRPDRDDTDVVVAADRQPDLDESDAAGDDADATPEAPLDQGVFDPADLEVATQRPESGDDFPPPPAAPAEQRPFDPNEMVVGAPFAEAGDMADVVSLPLNPPAAEALDDGAEHTEDGRVFAFGPTVDDDEPDQADQADQAGVDETAGEPQLPADEPEPVGATETPEPEVGADETESDIFTAISARAADGIAQIAEAEEAEEAERAAAAAVAAATPPDAGSMFKKKSNFALPKIGVDAAEWYSSDEPSDEPTDD